MQGLLAVFIGGGVGSLSRYAISRFFESRVGDFPWATFMANAISCIILGFLIGYFLDRPGIDNRLKLLLMTGFCGGFSTFSTFSGETFSLLSSGHFFMALLNILISVCVCLLCIFVGFKTATLI